MWTIYFKPKYKEIPIFNETLSIAKIPRIPFTQYYFGLNEVFLIQQQEADLFN